MSDSRLGSAAIITAARAKGAGVARAERSSARTQAPACVTAMLAIPHDALRVVAAPPDTISQRNVEAVTGVPSRVYLEAVRDPGFPLAVTRLGKLRIVNRAAFVAWLEKGAFGAGREDEDAEEELGKDEREGVKDEGEEQADEILDALGLRGEDRAKGRRKGAGRR